MISVDTNILLYAFDSECPEHKNALSFVAAQRDNQRFVICELVLVEFYCLIRNPVLVRHPLSGSQAAAVISAYRSNSSWRVIDYPGNLMGDIWRLAAGPAFPRRAIYDARLAHTLRHHGVTEFATRNVRDFQNFGFLRVWDPL